MTTKLRTRNTKLGAREVPVRVSRSSYARNMSAAVSADPCDEMLNFRAPGSLADLLDDLARRIGTSRSALIREAVVQYVQQLDDSDRGDPPNSP